MASSVKPAVKKFLREEPDRAPTVIACLQCSEESRRIAR